MAENLEIGKISKPRFEFRSFGQNFDNAAFRMSRLSVPVPENVWERHSDEIYIISRTNDVNNTKIRDGKMDIKTLVNISHGLEQWNPLMKGEFPMKTSSLLSEVFMSFQLPLPNLNKEEYTFDEFLQIVYQHPDLGAVRVHKQRFGYMVNNTICEYAVVLINGARVVSVSSESTEIDDILKTISDLKLEGVENINYLQAIKRVIGMIHKPLANE
ncbi:MAG TPA: hypothetical protein PK028_05755 [Bacteroidales bacterium]|mgnify:FL=1|jgi:hypothetical protein|nr:hypothetical protein [Bacteroidales bacterium]MDI9574771.1 hypothetical protein [Bacteroidota bacterium]OQC59791.1 MAG: hypothetical protein BWX51_01335 [Bacteroidetes bacterium ADurb.Bin012]MBP9511934.1 hypothetical protein [Bacteroidales bacterium]MBP9588432.1 hypothetical protein [Bacteroidales bacterium]